MTLRNLFMSKNQSRFLPGNKKIRRVTFPRVLL